MGQDHVKINTNVHKYIEKKYIDQRSANDRPLMHWMSLRAYLVTWLMGSKIPGK